MSPIKTQKQRLTEHSPQNRPVPAPLERDPFVIVASCRTTHGQRIGVDSLLGD